MAARRGMAANPSCTCNKEHDKQTKQKRKHITPLSPAHKPVISCICLLPTAKCHAGNHWQRLPFKMVRTRAQTARALRQEQLLQGQRLQGQASPSGPANQVFQRRGRRRSQLTCVQGSRKRKTRRATNKNTKNPSRQAPRDAPSNHPSLCRHEHPATVTSGENPSDKNTSDKNPSKQALCDAPFNRPPPSQASHDTPSQPNYAVGFQHGAFTDDKVKLAPYIGDYNARGQSYLWLRTLCAPPS